MGIVFDKAIENDLLLRHLQVADAARATLGLPVMEYTITDTSLQVEKWIDSSSGTSTGRIGESASLLRAVDLLISRSGVEAVAVVARFPDDDLEEIEDYRKGEVRDEGEKPSKKTSVFLFFSEC